MFWRLIAFLGLSLINPLCMAVSFCVCMGMDVYRPTSTNVVTFDARFFPVYLTIGMLVLLLQLFLVYGIARLTYRGRLVTVAKIARAFLSAQKPFLFLVLALPLLMGDVEGNVLAFGAIFAFPFIIVAGVFAALSLFRKLKATVEEPSNEGVAFMAGVTGATAIAVCASFLVIWTYGPINGFGEWLSWRSDTPQYAIRRVVEAIETSDVAKLEAYVDVDAILAQFSALGGPGRAGLMGILVRRPQAGDARGEIGYKEWRVQPFGNGDAHPCNLALLREREGTFTAEIAAQSEVTGQYPSLIFAMEPVRGKYRITHVNNMPDVVRSSQEEEQRLRKTAAMAGEAKAKAQSLAEVHLLMQNIVVEGETPRFAMEVANKGATPIARLQCVVLLKRKDTGALVLAETVWPDFYPGGLSPGRTETVKADVSVPPVVGDNIDAGRLVLADLFPVKIEYADSHTVDLVKLPD